MDTKTVVDSELQVNENDTQIHIKGRGICLYMNKHAALFMRDEIRRAEYLEPSDGIKYLEAPTDNDMYIKSEWKESPL